MFLEYFPAYSVFFQLSSEAIEKWLSFYKYFYKNGYHFANIFMPSSLYYHKVSLYQVSYQ